MANLAAAAGVVMSRVTGSVVTVVRKGGPGLYVQARDRNGRQIKKRLGPAHTGKRRSAPDGWTRKQADDDAIAKHSRRGWRIDKPTRRTHVDGIIALMMAVDRVENQPAPAQVVGWL